MITLLVDHNIEGQAMLLWGMLSSEGWTELIPLKLVTFAQVGLSYNLNDREVWRFAQESNMILLTANRRMKEQDSLEQTIREENSAASLPVITIGNVSRMTEKSYRERCARQLIEILIDLKNCFGTGRIFIP